MFRKYFTTITLTFVNLAAASPTPAAQDEAPQVFASGAVIPNVTALANPRQSYALYLPLKYSREHRWPVIYVFDPGARGQLALQQFQRGGTPRPDHCGFQQLSQWTMGSRIRSCRCDDS